MQGRSRRATVGIKLLPSLELVTDIEGNSRSGLFSPFLGGLEFGASAWNSELELIHILLDFTQKYCIMTFIVINSSDFTSLYENTPSDIEQGQSIFVSHLSF